MERCPRIRDLVRLARDTAIFRFQPAGHIRGPNEPILGPTDTVLGPHGSKHGQKATQTVSKLILSINHQLGQRNHLGPSTEAPGPVFGDFGPFGPRFGPHLGPAPGTAPRSHEALGGRQGRPVRNTHAPSLEDEYYTIRYDTGRYEPIRLA